jgi:hypothetical protein
MGGRESLTGEDSYDISILRPVVSLHYELMGSCYQGETVVVVERFGDVLPKGVASTTRRDSPSAPVIWVRPEQVAHWSLVGYFLNTVEGADVVQRVNARREPTVQTKDLVVDQGGEGKVVEEVGEVFPDISVAIFSKALVVEAVYLCNLTRLVIAAQDGDALRISDLERDEKSHSLHREVASIDIITLL